MGACQPFLFPRPAAGRGWVLGEEERQGDEGEEDNGEGEEGGYSDRETGGRDTTDAAVERNHLRWVWTRVRGPWESEREGRNMVQRPRQAGRDPRQDDAELYREERCKMLADTDNSDWPTRSRRRSMWSAEGGAKVRCRMSKMKEFSIFTWTKDTTKTDENIMVVFLTTWGAAIIQGRPANQ